MTICADSPQTPGWPRRKRALHQAWKVRPPRAGKFHPAGISHWRSWLMPQQSLRSCGSAVLRLKDRRLRLQALWRWYLRHDRPARTRRKRGPRQPSRPRPPRRLPPLPRKPAQLNRFRYLLNRRRCLRCLRRGLSAGARRRPIPRNPNSLPNLPHRLSLSRAPAGPLAARWFHRIRWPEWQRICRRRTRTWPGGVARRVV